MFLSLLWSHCWTVFCICSVSLGFAFVCRGMLMCCCSCLCFVFVTSFWLLLLKFSYSFSEDFIQILILVFQCSLFWCFHAVQKMAGGFLRFCIFVLLLLVFYFASALGVERLGFTSHFRLLLRVGTRLGRSGQNSLCVQSLFLEWLPTMAVSVCWLSWQFFSCKRQS